MHGKLTGERCRSHRLHQEEQRQKITHFIVQDTTRFARNDVVKAVACAELKKLNVTLISVDEPM